MDKHDSLERPVVAIEWIKNDEMRVMFCDRVQRERMQKSEPLLPAPPKSSSTSIKYNGPFTNDPNKK